MLQKIIRLLPARLLADLSAVVCPIRLHKGGFFRNVLVLMSGMAVGQLIGLLVSPLLTRLYSPSNFGLLACYLAIAAVINAGVTLQYSQGLMLPRSDEVASRLLLASCLSTLVVACGVFLLSVVFPQVWPFLFRTQSLGMWAFLLPVSVLLGGLNQSFNAWCLRRKAFDCTAKSLVVSSSAKACVQATGGFMGAGIGCLIGGVLLGDMLSNLLLWRRIRGFDGGMIRAAFHQQLVFSTARDYKDFPLYSAPQSVFSEVSQGAPVILLAHYYGIAVGGFYALAARVLDAPVRMALGSLRQALFQKLSELHNRGENLVPVFSRCTLSLFAGVLLPSVIGFVLAPRSFAFIFGQRWYVSGEIARWLLIWLVPMFCNLPAALLLRILRKQRTLLVFDLVLLTARASILIAGNARKASAVSTIIAFSVVGAMFEVWLIWHAWRVLKMERGTYAVKSDSSDLSSSTARFEAN